MRQKLSVPFFLPGDLVYTFERIGVWEKLFNGRIITEVAPGFIGMVISEAHTLSDGTTQFVPCLIAGTYGWVYVGCLRKCK